MATINEDIVNTTARILQEWGNEATGEMQRLLKTRLKQNSQVSQLAESIDWTGTKVSTNGTVAVWNLNDYWVYVDLGVKGVQNRSKYYKSLEFPTGFSFKTLGVGTQMRNAMQNYIARKGIKVDPKKGQSRLEASFQKAYAMSRAVKKKGIDGTRFYSDVFNEKGFKKLTDRLEAALGKEIEITIVTDIKG